MMAAVILLAAMVAPADARKPPTYKTPGYKGIKKAPRTKAPKPPRAIELAAAGTRPNVLVDDAGTAHVVWNEEGGDNPDVLHYCRLPRGARACDNPDGTRAFVPDQPYDTPGNSPAFNEDTEGPRVVAIGDQLILMTRRYPNVVPKPADGDVDTSVYLWVSGDGGNSFTGPGLAGDGYLSGGAFAFTAGGAERIATISDTATGGTYLQVLRPGAFVAGVTNLGAGDVNRAYAGSLAPDGTTVATAFADLSNQIFVRRWSGVGDPADPGTWSQDAPIAGSEPRLAGGPSGLFLMSRAKPSGRYSVRRLQGGSAGRAVTVGTTSDEAERDLFEDAGGGLHAGWINRQGSDGQAELLRRFSADGRTFRTSTLLARAKALGSPDLAGAFDGGGFGVFERDGGIAAAAFGNPAKTGRAGLGARSGGGLPPGTVSSCQRVSFGAVRISADEGCLLGAASGGPVKVSEGPLRLNGLEIVPDAGVKLVINPRTQKLDAVGANGSVRVLLRAPAVGEIVLWHGGLNLDLKKDGVGALIASFPTSQFSAVLKGFGIEGKIDVFLERDGVRIPVFLKLPPEFGGITGEATLFADVQHGLRLNSLKIDAQDILIGPLQIKKLHVEWSEGDNWAAEFLLDLPGFGGSLGGSAEFEDGDFVHASVTVPLPPPGVPVFTGVYLTQVGAEFGLKPLEFAGSVRITAVGAVSVDGTVRAKFPSGAPAEFSANGTLSVADFAFANASALFRTDGYFQAQADVGLDLSVLSVNGSALFVIDGPQGAFGAEIEAELCVDLLVDVCGHGQAVLSSKGFGACVGAKKSDEEPSQLEKILGKKVDDGDAYARYRWGDPIPGGIHVGLGSCSLDAVRVQPRVAQAGGTSFDVARGSRVESLTVTGAGGPPSVVLVAPGGERITPASADGPGVRAWGGPLEGTATTLIALPSPAPGGWSIEAAPGSPAIAGVEQQSDRGPLKGTVRLRRGKGGKRVLTYRIERRQGVRVRFVERGRQGGGEIGYARATHGSLQFTPRPGRAGRRNIIAVIERDGVPSTTQVVAHYRAPGPQRPGRVRGLRAGRHGKTLLVRWKSASSAERYAVRVSSSRGLSRLQLTRGRKLRVRGVSRGDRVRVSVRGVSREGLLGPASAARLRR
jgi:hypothetical protein